MGIKELLINKMCQEVKMTNFEHGKLTLAGYKVNEDGQRVEVLGLNPFFVNPLPS